MIWESITTTHGDEVILREQVDSPAPVLLLFRFHSPSDTPHPEPSSFAYGFTLDDFARLLKAGLRVDEQLRAK